MTPEMTEKAKKCETTENRKEFLAENGVELTNEQLEGIAGGGDKPKFGCPANPKGKGCHRWVKTGRERPGSFFGKLWPDEEWRCEHCGKLAWS